jgi:hypothetical protein
VRDTIAVAVVAAVASSALTLLLSDRFRAPPAASPPPAPDFKAALSDLEREVAGLRADLAGMPRGTSPVPPPSDPGAALATAPPLPAPTPAPPVVREDGTPEPPADVTMAVNRFLEVLPTTAEGEADGSARAAMKRRWLFRGEREVLDHFGLPHTIQVEGEAEIWHFEVPLGILDDEGNMEHANYWIKLNRGRLIDLGD